MHVLRKRIEPEPPLVSTPAQPSAPIPDQPMEQDGVSLASPPAVPPPPLPEPRNEGEQPEQQQEERQEERQEEQQQPPPPTGTEDLMTPTDPQLDSKTGWQIFCVKSSK